MHAFFDISLPLFGIILAGYVVGRCGVLGAQSSEALNGFVYWVALPAVLFGSTARVPLADVLNGPFIAAYAGGSVLSFILAVAPTALGFGGRPRRRPGWTLQGLAAIFANTGYMGVPLFLTTFGSERVLPAVIATVFNGAVMMGVGVVLAELESSRGGRWTHILADVGRALAGNPLILAPLAGLCVRALNLPLPAPIANFCNLLGAAAAPCALFALGLFLVGKPVGGGVSDAAELGWTTLVKLAVQPALTWLLAGPVLRMDPFWVASATLLSALPTAALVFTLAQQYRVGVERASSATLVTTIVSAVTLPALLILFGLN
jgi:hypothetical protein